MGSRSPVEFRGTERFAVIRRIGSGGMGAVYEALDRERGERVALKTLHRLDPRLLYRLKSEFRVLQDLHHPNLIKLGQLIEESGSWFFTMELIDGEDFLAHVRAPEKQVQPTAVDIPRARKEVEEAQTVDIVIAEGSDTFALPSADDTLHPPGFDPVRLRRCLEGVAEGLHALHRRGVVHCDVKPTNILVTRDGRVVLLDFGLATDTTTDSSEGIASRLVGTPAYMAPELADGSSPGAASDWYSLGVTLYQALTGRLPFRGGTVQMLTAKLTTPPPAPSSLCTDVPKDLEQLCLELLSAHPGERPSGNEILSRVSGAPTQEIISRTPPPVLGNFVGRVTELERLREAFDELTEGNPVAVYVRARSGLGKTALVNRFLAEVRGRSETLVLSGRCYERESVPFKAFDHLVDGLSNHLQLLPRAEAASLLPRHVGALAGVFPVLAQVDAVAAAPRPARKMDPREERSRAFSALKELLARLADRRRLVLFIDDLQWGDIDSAALLSDLLRPPDPPNVLFIGAFRAEDASAPVIQSLPRVGHRASGIGARQITLEPLSESEGRELAVSLVGVGAPDAAERAEAIVREAGGSPLFLGEIARHLEATSESSLASGSREISLETVISRRIRRLPDDAKKLLEVIACIGRPFEQELAFRAAELRGGGDAAIGLLGAANLITTHSHGGRDTVETYHDRIRETVFAELSSERTRQIQSRVAEVIEESEWIDAELLALDLRVMAGGAKTFDYVLASALRAEKSLAFERAAGLFTQAMELAASSEQATKLRRKRAEVLSYAGRGAEAADDYIAAAEVTADEESKIDLIRLAADNLLHSGHIQRGLEQLEDVMLRLGIQLPRSRAGAIWSLLTKRVRLATRGLRYTPRPESHIAPRDLSRIDTLFAAATSLGMIDHLRGSVVQTQHLLWALKLGEERRVCRALGTESSFLGPQGGRAARKAEKLASETIEKANRLGDPYLMASSHLAMGAVHFFNGRFPKARDHFTHAVDNLAPQVGSWWEKNTARFFLTLAQINTGDFLGYAPAVQRFIDEAERRNDAYARYLFQCHPGVWCAMRLDEVEATEEILETVLDGWPAGAHYQSHYTVMVSKTMCLLYRGDGDTARELLDGAMPMLRKLMIHRLPMIMGEWQKLVGRAALLQGDVDTAEKMARGMDKIGMDVGFGMSANLRAPIAVRAGNLERAQSELARAIEAYGACGAEHLVTACRYRAGQLLGGEEGDGAMQEATEWMVSRGVVSPERMIRWLTPGYP